MQKFCCENDFDLHETKLPSETHWSQPVCDYVVAMAMLKVVDTQLNIKILARDEWTTPESFNIIE